MSFNTLVKLCDQCGEAFSHTMEIKGLCLTKEDAAAGVGISQRLSDTRAMKSLMVLIQETKCRDENAQRHGTKTDPTCCYGRLPVPAQLDRWMAERRKRSCCPFYCDGCTTTALLAHLK